MKKLFLYSAWLGFLVISTSTFGAEKTKRAKEVLVPSSAKAEFRLALNNNFELNLQNVQSGENAAVSTNTRSVAKAVLLSAAIPGGGQIYNGSWLKSVAFLAVEAAALTGHFHFRNRGNDLEAQFEADADRLWSQDAYWDWIANISDIDRTDMAALREFERNNFSHFLPENRNQQYYENIGKYDQFIAGWDDFREAMLNGDVSNLSLADYKSGAYNGQDLTTISAHRNSYVELRRDSNDNFKRATNMVTVAVFNHLVSAIEAGLSAKRYNQSQGFKAKLRMRGLHYENKLVPALSLGMTW